MGEMAVYKLELEHHILQILMPDEDLQLSDAYYQIGLRSPNSDLFMLKVLGISLRSNILAKSENYLI